MNDAAIAEKNLAKAMQLEMQRVLMEDELTAETLDRLDQMVRGAKAFLTGLQPRHYVVKRDPLAEAAEKIQAERYRQLGFTPEMVEQMRAASEHERREATEGLIRSAQIHGVAEDDEEVEVEEVAVRVLPAEDREIWLPIGLVDRIIQVLGGSDGDVVDHLIDLVNDCRMKAEGNVQPDAILPVDIGLVHLIAAGLTDPKVVAERPEAMELADELSTAISTATARLHESMKVMANEARAEA